MVKKIINKRSYILKSLRFYWKAHLALFLGMAAASAILTGALVIGDSVSHTLKRMAVDRLGFTHNAISTGDRFFHKTLDKRLSGQMNVKTSSLLALQGLAININTQQQANHVQILGIDNNFFIFNDLPGEYFIPGKSTVYINERLAASLNLSIGDYILIRVNRPGSVPGDTPFASKDQNTAVFEAEIARILPDRSIGRFDLLPNQVAPNNVFISYEYLSKTIDLPGKANMLLTGEIENSGELAGALKKAWSAKDAEITVTRAENRTIIKTDRIFLDSIIEKAADSLFSDTEKIFTYFVQAFSYRDKKTPYSFVSGLSSEHSGFMLDDHEIILSSWIAEDLGAKMNDTISIAYLYPVLDQLETRYAEFIVKNILDMQAFQTFGKLTPDYPGLTDSENCRDWDTGIPIDINQIRNKDETYWDEYGSMPKAVVSLQSAKNIWANRFGALTSIRLPATHSPQKADEQLAQALDPADFGLVFQPVRETAAQAGIQGVDFSELFAGLSFFLLAAGFILIALLFSLSIDQRAEEAALLRSIGFRKSEIYNLFAGEAACTAFPGIIAGTGMSILYNLAVLEALGGIWKGATGTSGWQIFIHPGTLALGGTISLTAVLIVLYLTARSQMKKQIHELQNRIKKSSPKRRLWMPISAFLMLAALFTILLSVNPARDQHAASAFWVAGILGLCSGVLIILFMIFKSRCSPSTSKFTIRKLAFLSLTQNPSRSGSIIILLALAAFIIFSVSANRFTVKQPELRESGTGGFTLFVETSLPVYSNLNQETVQRRIGLRDDDYNLSFIQIRVNEGGDASCLNLNRVQNPRIMGLPAMQLDSLGAFSMNALLPGLNHEKPWTNLKKDFGNNIIPAYADQDVITWGLGKQIGDTLIYQNESGKAIYLVLAGALSNSIFQGSLLIDLDYFITHFPSVGGSNVFLADSDREKQDEAGLLISRSLRNYGADVTRTDARLARFLEVQNTYLDIFLLLGALGMLLGTAGLGIVIYRNIIERQGELALMQAVGFRKKIIIRIQILENTILIITGLTLGLISSGFAVFPALAAPGTYIPYRFILGMIILVFVSGLFWTILFSHIAMKKDLLPALRNE